MLIQPILFPDKKYSIEPELFFHGTSDGNIAAGNTVSIESYFNAFSIGKWREYTNLNNLSLQLEADGDIEIKAFHAVGSLNENFLQRGAGKLSEDEYIRQVNEKAYSAVRTETEVKISKVDSCYTVNFINLPKDGILFVTIKAISDAKLIGGGYHTQVDETLLNPVKVAVGICTFKREEFVKRNVGCLKSDLIDNTESPLYNKLEVYIADNGQTLDKASFDDKKVHLFPNPNLGGAGGFTRTMIEAMFHDKAKHFTHIIFMDDDILLYPPVLERTYYLLRMLKDGYKKAILGGGMFLLDQPYLQQETGAVYKDTITYIGKANHKLFDLRLASAVSANEVVGPTNYTGWWYACIPKTIVTEQNLPMPFFIHYDDAEYGIRNVKNKEIYINGIGIWHPSPVNKSPLWMSYYDMRNRLITMFSKPLDKMAFRKYLKAVTKMFFIAVLRFEYTKAKLYLCGMEDFLKGSQNFIESDALFLHKRLQKNKVEYLSLDAVGIGESKIIKGVKKNFLIAGMIQLFYTIMPTKNEICAVDAWFNYIPHNAKKYYLYFDKFKAGFVVEKNRKKFFSLLFKFCFMVIKLNFKFDFLRQDWQSAKQTLTSLSFWEKYLGISNEG